MILKSAHTIPKKELTRINDPNGMINYVAERTTSELCTKLADILCDNKPRFIRMMESYMLDDPATHSMSYRQDLHCVEIVQCEKCKYNPEKPRAYIDQDLVDYFYWCPYFIKKLGGKGFCPFGEE